MDGSCDQMHRRVSWLPLMVPQPRQAQDECLWKKTQMHELAAFPLCNAKGLPTHPGCSGPAGRRIHQGVTHGGSC